MIVGLTGIVTRSIDDNTAIAIVNEPVYESRVL